ncbi:hypothetical protein M9H77_09394 [Catharanthus roseus]|uniref:Uncharacterized protein n=1 Tax=Catharanthus roseus TaxID=4058 RepID=A0ACC0C0P5_CATRO|nr:hypothetical protein M9H77_09394 [Catharanthus roseus]
MEEVPAHVQPGTIVPDVLSRHGDHETCYIDLQCRRFGQNLFQCYSTAPHRLVEIIDKTGVNPKQYWIDLIERLLGVRLSLSHFSGYKVKKEPLEAWILRALTSSETDDDLILRSWIYFLTHWRTHASRLLREFGSCVLPQFIRGY